MALRTAREPAITVPDESILGECMLALTTAQRAFVTALVETGARDQTECAMVAGIGGSKESAAVWASRAMRNPKIIAAVREEADRRLRGGALLASSALIEIASDVRHKDRFKASVELLNRAGLLVETQHRVIVENDTRSTDEIKAAVVDQFKKLYAGQPLPLALQKPIDGDYTIVDPDLEELCS